MPHHDGGPPRGALRRALDGLYQATGVAAAALLVAMCLVVSGQVVLNLVDRVASVLTGSAIGLTIPSYSDFTGFFLAAASFLALAYTFRAGGHIRVSLVIQQLPPGIRRIVEIWCVGAAAAASVYFAVYTALMVRDSFIYHDVSPGMVAVPVWIPQSAMLIGLTVFVVALVDDLARLVADRPPSYAGKAESLLTGGDGRGDGEGPDA